MNFQLKKAGYKKVVTNFSSDIKVYSSVWVVFVSANKDVPLYGLPLACMDFHFSMVLKSKSQ